MSQFLLAQALLAKNAQGVFLQFSIINCQLSIAFTPPRQFVRHSPCNSKFFLAIALTLLPSLLFAKKPASKTPTTPPAAEAAPAPAPKWVADVRAVYPNAEFIAQQGEGKTSEEAKSDALGAIARYFDSKVEVNIASHSQSVTDGKSVSRTAQVRNDVLTTSRAQLFGVEYSETYYSESLQKYLCVAYINRDYAWGQFAPKIEQEKAAFYQFYNEAARQAKADPLFAKKYFALAKPHGEALLELLEYARVLSEEREKSYAPEREAVAGVDKRIEDAAQGATVFLDISGDYAGIIGTRLQNAFQSTPLAVSKAREAAPYIAKVVIEDNLETEGEGTETAIYGVTPSLSVSIASAATGKPLFAYARKAAKRSVAYSKANALKKALPPLADEIERTFAAELNEVIGSRGQWQ